MTRTIFQKKSSSVKLPQRSGESQHNEYLREQKGIVICPECHNVHFAKEWHHSGSVPTERIAGKKRFPEKKILCPACVMAQDHLFEGEVVLENFPERFDEEILNLLRGFGRRAVALDPQDRILGIEKRRNGNWYIWTTENQLAVKIAKKIRDMFNTVELHISHSREPYEVERIRAVFSR